MSKKQIDGIWVIVCDWVDPGTEERCNLGAEGEPRMFVDPDRGEDPDKHFQCGIHHGILKQEDRPEFQVPEEEESEFEMDYIVPEGDDGRK